MVDIASDRFDDEDDDAAKQATTTPIEPLAPERVADRLLLALRETSPLAVFDWAERDALTDLSDDASLRSRKMAADLLVKSKLAHFTDDARAEIAITNAGRYWSISGGYLAYLKEDPSSASSGGGRQRNPDMEALRAEYMKLRLGTFWWSFGLSIAGFLMSIMSVAIALFYGDRLLR